jgi:putative solute:sodium symporter small subunit
MTGESNRWRFKKRLTAALLLLWAAVSFGVPYFALDLRFDWWGTPFSFWMASQGALLVYLVIVAVYSMVMNRFDAQQAANSKASDE